MVIIVFIFLLLLFKRARSRQGLSPSSFIILFYAVSALVSCVLFFTYPDDIYLGNFFSYIYYILCLFVFLLPFIYNSGNGLQFAFPEKSTKFLSWFVAVGGIIVIVCHIVNFDFTKTALSWAEQRGEYYKAYGEEEIATNIWDRISANVYPLMIISLPLSFYHLTSGNKKMSLMLFIASLSLITYALSRASRQELAIWLFEVLTSFLMFKGQLSHKIVKRVASFFVVIGGIVLLVLFSISISRFGEGDINRSLLAYFGEQPFNASYVLEELGPQKLWGQANFSYLVGKPYITEYNDYINSSRYLNVFGAIVGSYYMDFGYYSLFFIALVAMLFNISMQEMKKKRSIVFFYVYIIYLNMMAYGVFYFKFADSPTVRIFCFMGILLLFIENLNKKQAKQNRL